MTPPYGAGENLPLEKLDEYRFQAFSCELLSSEPDIAQARVYGARGYKQYGIDIILYRRDGGIEVVQCKKYGRFTLADLRSASDEFLNHWKQHWKGKGVKRFLLLLSCDLDDPRVEDEVEVQKKRFTKHKIAYELWTATEITRKAAQQRQLIDRFFPSTGSWTDLLCGPRPIAESSPAVSALAFELGEAATLLKSEVDKSLERLRRDIREGSRSQVVAELERLTEPSRWPHLPPKTRASILRLQAGVRLDFDNDPEEALQLLTRAKRDDPAGDDRRVRAKAALFMNGPQAALDIIGDAESTDELCFLAALHLLLGRFDAVRADLRRAEELSPDHPEGSRLGALLCACQGQMDQARLNIDKAREREPRWESVAVTAAILNYFSALAPGHRSNVLAGWPEPVSTAYVRRDENSLGYLDDAIRGFNSLIRRSDLPQHERRRFEAWKLASLANHPKRQVEARDYCRAVLSRDPGHAQVVAWALVRGYDIDAGATASVLETVLGDEAELDQIIVLVACLLATQQGGRALEVIERYSPRFDAANQIDLWHHWHVQCLVAGERAPEALAEIARLNYPLALRHAETTARRAVAEAEGREPEFIAYLEGAYQETANVGFLLEACNLRAKRSDWKPVAMQARVLLQIGTPETITLAAYALYHSGDYHACLEAIEQSRPLFLDNRLPVRIRQLRIACLDAVGTVPKLIAEADALAVEDGSTATLLGLARLCFRFGSFERLVATARKLAARCDLRPRDALELAAAVRHRSATLARTLWLKAEAATIPDDCVLLALDVGFAVGLDQRTSSLTQRAIELTRVGIVKGELLSVDEVISRQQSYLEGLNVIGTEYVSGTVCSHVVATHVGRTLVEWYWADRADANSYQPASSPALLAFHPSRAGGSENASVIAPKPAFELSTILLAEDSRLLDTLETTFGPIRISRNALTALTWMEQRLEPHQPARWQAQQQVLDLLHSGSLCGTAPEDCAPAIRLNFVSADSPRDCGGTLNCRAAIEGMQFRGWISAEATAAALEVLGNEGRTPPTGSLPERGERIVCGGGVAVLLSQAGVLEALCRNFRVQLEPEVILQLEAEASHFRVRQELITRLRSLNERLSTGLMEGTYELLPNGEELAEDRSRPPTLAALKEWIEFPAAMGQTVVADDQAINRFTDRGPGVRIACLLDLLNALTTTGTITREQEYAIRHRLRLANVRYLLPTAAEILHWLRAARIDAGEVVETVELRVLRQYLAACLMQGVPSSSGIVTDEQLLAGLANLRIAYVRTVREALVGLWADENRSDQERQTRAGWIMSALYIDLAGLRASLLPEAPLDGALHIAVVDACELLILGVTQLPTGGGESASAARRFLDWLEHRVLLPRRAGNSGFVEAVADQIKHIFREIQDCEEAKQHRLQTKLVLQGKVEDLPASVKRAMEADHTFMESIGVRISSVFTLGPLSFKPAEYTAAITKALERNGATLRTADGRTKVRVRHEPGKEGNSGTLVLQTEKEQFRISDELFQVLFRDVARRERAVRQHRDWFDCGEKDFERTVAALIAYRGAAARLERALTIRNASAAVYYGSLPAQLRGSGPILASDLMPDLEGLLRHFRLPANLTSPEEFGRAFEGAGEDLLQTAGVEEAIRRFANLPLPLPLVLRTAVSDLASPEYKRLLKTLLRSRPSPVVIIHILRLAADRAERDPGLARFARRLLLRISRQTLKDIKVFTIIIVWVMRWIATHEKAATWTDDVQLLLAWAHGSRLYGLYRHAGASPEWLKQAFRTPASFEYLPEVEAAWRRRARLLDPNNVTPELLLATGLGYACERWPGKPIDQAELGACFRADETDAPSPSLLRDPAALNDITGSFLGRDPLADLTGILGSTNWSFDPAWRNQIVTTAVQQLEAGWSDTLAWGVILVVFGQGDLPPSVAAAIDRGWEVHHLNDLFFHDTQASALLLKIAAVRLQGLRDESARHHVMQQLLEVAEKLADMDTLRALRHRFGDEDPLELLLNLFLSLGYTNLRERAAAAEFTTSALKLAERCPPIVDSMRLVFERLCLETPVQAGMVFWPALLRLRAIGVPA